MGQYRLPSTIYTIPLDRVDVPYEPDMLPLLAPTLDVTFSWVVGRHEMAPASQPYRMLWHADITRGHVAHTVLWTDSMRWVSMAPFVGTEWTSCSLSCSWSRRYHDSSLGGRDVVPPGIIRVGCVGCIALCSEGLLYEYGCINLVVSRA